MASEILRLRHRIASRVAAACVLWPPACQANYTIVRTVRRVTSGPWLYRAAVGLQLAGLAQ
jgi:hypothetical protein